MDVFIITGASKGIGYELAKQLQDKGKRVIGLARTASNHIEHFVQVDLLETSKLEKVMDTIIDENYLEGTSFTLINNAGIVDPIGIAGSISSKELEKALAINLTAPMIVTNRFIAKLKDFEGDKRVVNISSGAGRNPYEGWGVYCTTKAGLDHYSRVVAIEQEAAQYPVEIVSIAPGIIDTGMQEKIRESEAEAFPLLDKFIAYKEEGYLSSAEMTARKLIHFIENKDFNEVGPIADIRQV